MCLTWAYFFEYVLLTTRVVVRLNFTQHASTAHYALLRIRASQLMRGSCRDDDNGVTVTLNAAYGVVKQNTWGGYTHHITLRDKLWINCGGISTRPQAHSCMVIGWVNNTGSINPEWYFCIIISSNVNNLIKNNLFYANKLSYSVPVTHWHTSSYCRRAMATHGNKLSSSCGSIQ